MGFLESELCAANKGLKRQVKTRIANVTSLFRDNSNFKVLDTVVLNKSVPNLASTCWDWEFPTHSKKERKVLMDVCTSGLIVNKTKTCMQLHVNTINSTMAVHLNRTLKYISGFYLRSNEYSPLQSSLMVCAWAHWCQIYVTPMHQVPIT